MTRLIRQIVMVLGLAALCCGPACTRSENSAVDAKAVADSPAQPDMDKTPRISVRSCGPTHLQSQFPKEYNIEVCSTISNVDDATADAQVKSAFSLMTRVGKTPVAGTWTFEKSGHATRLGKFKPSSALADNTDYLVRLQKLGFLEPEREYTLFHVGPLPRVQKINFYYLKGQPVTAIDEIGVHFSEQVDTAKVAANMLAKVAGSTTALQPTLVSPDPLNNVVAVRLPSALALTTKLSITIPTDVGAPTGVKLDGNYSGASEHAQAAHQPCLQPRRPQPSARPPCPWRPAPSWPACAPP
jgi:hypothetical protein